jgi:hypothetical protein
MHYGLTWATSMIVDMWSGFAPKADPAGTCEHSCAMFSAFGSLIEAARLTPAESMTVKEIRLSYTVSEELGLGP